MQSDIERFIASTGKEVSNSFSISGDDTQSASHDFLGGLSGNQLYYSIEVLQKPGEECQESKRTRKNSNVKKARTMSTRSTRLPENDTNSSPNGSFGTIFGDIKPPKSPINESPKTQLPEPTTDVPDNNTVETTENNDKNLDNSKETESVTTVGKSPNEDVSKSLLGNMTKKFSNLCEILDNETITVQKLENELKISKILNSKDFTRDLNLSSQGKCETTLMEEIKGSTDYDDVVQYISMKKRNSGRIRHHDTKDKNNLIQSKSNVYPSSTMEVLKALEKGKPLGNRGQKRGKAGGFKGKWKKAQMDEDTEDEETYSSESLSESSSESWSETDDIPVRKKTLRAKKDAKPKASTPSDKTTKSDKSITTDKTTGKDKSQITPDETTKSDKSLSKDQSKDKDKSITTDKATGKKPSVTFDTTTRSDKSIGTDPIKIPEKPIRTDQATNTVINPIRELRRSVMDTDVLENLDKMGGIKYETGSEDLRRKYRSFERLCFGLGCTVPPTKQELEMCSQLSLWGDDSSLSQYETSVYQSCLLRSRSFDSIWRKFCNRVIGIIRRYTLYGVRKLLKILNEEPIVEPYLKMVLVDIGSDRQDQQLFISIMQEELNQMLRDNQILLKLTVTNNNNVDDIVNQMYIQMYQLLLLSSAASSGSSTDLRIGLSTENKDKYYYYLNQDYIEITKGNKKSNESQFSGENLLDGLVKLYEHYFSENELVLIIDRINPMINDILYMFQMLKRRKLMKISSVLLICSNPEYLERYCNSLIYSNLGIFECSMFMISCLVDDIVQVLLYDTKVQDFIPNFKMVMEIYETFLDQDSSLTLMILRVYQLYEQYYNKHIFSYLSIVPPFVFETDNGGVNEEYDIVMDVSTHWIYTTLSSHYEPILKIPEPKKSSKTNTKNIITKDRPRKRSKSVPKDSNKGGVTKDTDSATESDEKEGKESGTNAIEKDNGNSSDKDSVDSTSQDTTNDTGKDKNGEVDDEKNKDTEKLSTEKQGVSEDKESMEQVILPPESLMKSTDDANRLSDMSTTTSLRNNESISKSGSPYSVGSDTQKESTVGKYRELSFEMYNAAVCGEEDSDGNALSGNTIASTGTPGGKNLRELLIMHGRLREASSPNISSMPSNKVSTTTTNDRSTSASASSSNTSSSTDSASSSTTTTLENSSLQTNTHLSTKQSQNITNTTTNSNTNNNNDNTNDNNTITDDQLHTLTNTNNNNQSTTSSTTQHSINNSGVESVTNVDGTTSSRGIGLGAYGENMDYISDFDYVDSSDVEYEQYGDLNRTSMLKRAKRMYSMYSLLSISNNMSENYVAYLELKLVEELDLQKVILELLPLNTLILMQRRILFQLGVNFLFKLLIFLPDSSLTIYRIKHLIDAMPMFERKSNEDMANELDKPIRDLIKRVIKNIHKKCHQNINKEEGIESLKTIVVSFNNHYKSVIQPVMDIQLLLDGGRGTYESHRMINEYSTILDVNVAVPKLVKEIRHRLHMCFFPLIVTYKLAIILGVQTYSSTFRNTSGGQAVPSPVTEPAPAPAPPTVLLTTNTPTLTPTIGDLGKDKVGEQDIILYIYKYIRYKIINMWKLFIIYYYIATSKQTSPAKPRGLVEIYVKFNVNIELLEKIHKIVLLSQTSCATVTSKESRSLTDKKLPEGEVQLCYLMKNSLSNINVKFL